MVELLDAKRQTHVWDLTWQHNFKKQENIKGRKTFCRVLHFEWLNEEGVSALATLANFTARRMYQSVKNFQFVTFTNSKGVLETYSTPGFIYFGGNPAWHGSIMPLVHYPCWPCTNTTIIRVMAMEKKTIPTKRIVGLQLSG